MKKLLIIILAAVLFFSGCGAFSFENIKDNLSYLTEELFENGEAADPSDDGRSDLDSSGSSYGEDDSISTGDSFGGADDIPGSDAGGASSDMPGDDDGGSQTINYDAGLYENNYYFGQLDDDEKHVYLQLAAGCSEFKNKINVKSLPSDSFYKVQCAFYNDFPEYFWTGKFEVMLINRKVTAVKYSIPDNIAEISAQLDGIANDIISVIPAEASDYDKVKYFYEWIIDNTGYNFGEVDQDIRSVFFNHESVCAGYSHAFQFLCKKAGIPCAYVYGHTGSNDSHAWNLIRIGGAYYWVDVTWGDPVYLGEQNENSALNYNYLCVTDREIFETHTIDRTISSIEQSDTEVFSFPECTDDSYNYYRLTGAYFEVYDRETVKNYIRAKLDAGQYSNIELKFDSHGQYQAAVNDMFSEDSYLFNIVFDANPEFYGRASYNYTYDEKTNYICMSIALESE
ncbi:MAG: hypothetical protein IJM37_06620 [Lachnospiraceae bacterium]|nr:hypothetical protein [Lachnospiraceae bacterium]